MFSESDRSSTGRDRKIPSDLFKKLHDSFTAFSQKSAGGISRQLSPQTTAGARLSSEDTPQDLDNATPVHSLDAPDNPSDCHAQPRKKTKLENIDRLPPSNHCTFTVTLSKRTAARIRAMDNAQKRLLICRATKRDPDKIACHSGKPWIVAVRLKSEMTLEVSCHDKHERSLLLAANISTRILESAMDGQHVTFGVLMADVQADRLSLQPEVKNYMAAQMLAAANASALPSLVDHKDLISVQRRHSEIKGAADLEIGFASPEQANEAILHGLTWEEKQHKCTRLVKDSEVQNCKNCQRFGHTRDECPNETTCELCLRLHLTKRCLRQGCSLCGKQHSPGSLCKFYGIERGKVKEILQSQQPLWPVKQDSISSIPLGITSHRSLTETSQALAHLQHQARHYQNSTYGSALLAGAGVPSTRNSRSASASSATDSLGPPQSPAAAPIQCGGTSRVSVPNIQHLGRDPRSMKYDAILEELHDNRSLVSTPASNSAVPVHSPAPVALSKKRTAISVSHIDTADESHPYTKRIRYTRSSAPQRINDELEDPVEAYVRENGCVTVEAGEGLRNALERAGIVTEPPPRAKPWRRRRQSPVAESSWYKWSPYERPLLNASLEECQQPLDLDYRGTHSTTEQRGHPLPASHQLPYSCHHDEDLSGGRISAYE